MPLTSSVPSQKFAYYQQWRYRSSILWPLHINSHPFTVTVNTDSLRIVSCKDDKCNGLNMWGTNKDHILDPHKMVWILLAPSMGGHFIVSGDRTHTSGSVGVCDWTYVRVISRVWILMCFGAVAKEAMRRWVNCSTAGALVAIVAAWSLP